MPGFLKPISPFVFVALADKPRKPWLGPWENLTKISVGFFLWSTVSPTALDIDPGLAVHQIFTIFPP